MSRVTGLLAGAAVMALLASNADWRKPPRSADHGDRPDR